MNILLIDANPSWLRHEKTPAFKEQVVLPIGLMYLGACLKKAFGQSVKVKLVNTIIDDKDPVEVARQFCPEIIGIRVLSMGKDLFYELVKKIRIAIPQAKIFAGGPFPSSEPEKVLRESNVDGIVIGEGERTFVEMVDRIMRRAPLDNVKGLGYRHNDEVLINPAREPIDNVDELPFPDYSLIDVEKYGQVINYGYTIRKQAVILTGRGCPFACKYCFKFMGQAYRPRSASNVFTEIKYLYDTYNIKDFFIVDDTFNIKRGRCEDILNQIINSGIKIRLYFTSGLRGDLLDEQLIDLLIKAGMVWASFGVESVNPRIQRLINRIADMSKLKSAIELCGAKGIMVGIFFMIGFPTETYSEAYETLDFVRNLKGVTMPYLFGVRYFPSTELYRLAMEEGMITPALQNSVYEAYHDMEGLETPTLSNAEFKMLFMEYMRDIFLNRERLNRALDAQEQYLTAEELTCVYSAIMKRKIKSPREALKAFL